MKGFAVGVAVGAALGVAATWATWAAMRRADVADDDRPPSARNVAAPAAVLAASGTPVARRATSHAPDAAIEPPAASSASAPPPKAIDVRTASLDELVAALRGPIDDSGKLPGGLQAAAVCRAIAERFPDFVYPPDLVRNLAKVARRVNQVMSALDRAVATWTDDVALGEFARLAHSGTEDDKSILFSIGRVLHDRGRGIPSDTCSSLLRDADPDMRCRGALLFEYANDVDVAALRTVASHDADSNVRSQAIWALRLAVVDQERVRPDEVSETILSALRDPEESVRDAAERSLVAAGPKGAQTALEIVLRDGEVDEASDLVLAVVADGRAAEILDARPSKEIAGYVADSLAELADKRPQLLRDAAPRFAELRAAAASESRNSLERFLVASRKVLGSRVLAETVLARDLDVSTRRSAVDVLLDEPTTWQEGHDLVRRIAADRTEGGRMRLEAIVVLSQAPEGREEEIRAESRKFLADLLPAETNDRVRAQMEQRLKELKE
jgi:hypothetical protein